jgi:hypothetical protein
VPVSKAIRAYPSGRLGDASRYALAVLDEVHGDGNLPPLPIRSSRAHSYHGQYSFYSNGPPADIKLSTISTHPEFTTLHEVGHFLDHHGIGEPGVFASLTPGKLDGWWEAVSNSDAIIELQRLSTLRQVTVRMENGKDKPQDIDHYHVQYLLTRHETFARSYAQYIAAKSKDPVLLKQLEEIRNDPIYTSQWGDDDFAPIEKALDALFEGLGWLN